MTDSPALDTHDTPAPTEPQSIAHEIFFGRFGFRAGWSIAIVLVVIGVLTFIGSFAGVAATGHLKEILATRAAASANPKAPHSAINIPFAPQLVVAYDGIIFFGLLAFCWLLSRAERRPIRYYGIGKSRFLDIIPGAIWGVLIMSALAMFLRARHLLVFDGRALHGAPIFYYGAAWLVAFLLVGFAEEYQFRGYVQYTLMRGFWGLAERISPNNPQPVAFWIAATVLSLGFGAVHIHNEGENILGIAQVVFVGMVFAYALYRTGSLWWGIGFHALWDWSQSFLFGVADSGNVSLGRLFVTHPQGNKLLSGGTDGPEGSVFAAIAVFLTIFAIRLTTKPGIQPIPEQLPKVEESLPPETNAVIA